MITVLESIRLSTQYLNEKGIDSSRINAELLLADVLNCKRLDLYLLFDRPLSEPELKKYREYIRRRGKFEPLQYILGKVEFYGLKLMVTSAVLIPRPETEILVETIINQFSEQVEIAILDIGCGTGNISIALAKKIESVKIISTDISEDALDIANMNAKNNMVESKIEFINHDILKNNLDNFQQFDIIVSNPPYVSIDNFKSLQKEIIEFEPKAAVTDNNDGYTFYRIISEKAKNKLKPNGKLFFEIAEGQSDEVKKIMEKNNFLNIKAIKDYQSIDRVVYGGLK